MVVVTLAIVVGTAVLEEVDGAAVFSVLVVAVIDVINVVLVVV